MGDRDDARRLLEQATAQLRHLYLQLKSYPPSNWALADGLLSPQIKQLEEAAALLSEPSPDARLLALVEEWRRQCEVTRAEMRPSGIREHHQEGPRYGIAAVEQCADDLAALLPPAPSPEERTER